MRLLRLIPILSVILLLAAPAAMAAGNDGRIEGVVTNGTTEAQVGNQPVKLTIYLNGSEMESKTATTDAAGAFVFSGLSTAGEYSYSVTVTYQEADYPSETASFTDGILTKVIDVTVYDSTSDPGALTMDVAHTIVVVSEDGLLVQNFGRIVNPTKLTYVGSRQLAPDKKETAWFSLPAGATDVQYGGDLMSCCVIPGEGGFSDTMPVLPGMKQAVFTYVIPYRSDSLLLTQKFDYPTGRYDLLIPDGITVSANGLTSLGKVDLDGDVFSNLLLENIAAGDSVQVALSGLPKTGQGALRWWLPSAGLLLAAAVTGVLLWKKKEKPIKVRADAGPAQQRQRLLLEIARLDDDFEMGRVDEGAYRRLRAQKKAQLLRTMQASGERS